MKRRNQIIRAIGKKGKPSQVHFLTSVALKEGDYTELWAHKSHARIRKVTNERKKERMNDWTSEPTNEPTSKLMTVPIS